MNEFRGLAAAIALFVLPLVGGVAMGRFAGRGRWLARVFFVVSVAFALVIGHTLTHRNASGYRVLTVLVELPFAVGAAVVALAGTIAGLALGKRLRRPR